MPHAHSVPSPGLQAIILCGPGVSLNTFTSSPEEFPKALVPIANRPMIWYPLDWCYRLGITNIHLITPPSAASAIDAALATDPHLTSLPLPRADILAPRSLSQNTGTAEIFRLPEVRAVITGDFVVLPCDLICGLPGQALLELWMIKEAKVDTLATDAEELDGSSRRFGRERKAEYRGGLGVWYQTKGDEGVKAQETDLVAIVPSAPLAVPPPKGSLVPKVSELVYSISTDTLNDIAQDKKSFPIRHALLRKHGRVKLLSSHRAAHVYIFPYWVLDWIKRNEKFESISEDVVGWWAKAGWQDGLGDKLGFGELFPSVERLNGDEHAAQYGFMEGSVDLGGMSTTGRANGYDRGSTVVSVQRLASRASSSKGHGHAATITHEKRKATAPPILAYMHPSGPSAPIIRRVDTGPLLLAVSLRLAKLDALDEGAQSANSPFAHKSKIANPGGVAQRCTVTKADCLLGDNVIVEEKSVIKESVIGANCSIEKGVRLTRCVLMDGVVVGERCQLSGCILGRKSKVGKESVLRDCEVQGGYQIPEKTDAKNEKFMDFQGLEDGDMEEELDMQPSGSP